MRRIVRTGAALLLLIPAYALFAYVVMPVSWRQYHRLAGQTADAAVTRTAEGIPADPLNVAFVGTPEEVAAAMGAAGWCAADRISLRSGIRDATSVVFHRPYASAPVSTHLLGGRPQDLAFEQIVGGSPRQRHHVRLWRVNRPSDARDTVWVGAATYDRGLGLSPYTGEVIHHIATQVDTEREKLVVDLGNANRVARLDRFASGRPAGPGRNGSGDAYETDGKISVVVLGHPYFGRGGAPPPPPAEVARIRSAAISRRSSIAAL